VEEEGCGVDCGMKVKKGVLIGEDDGRAASVYAGSSAVQACTGLQPPFTTAKNSTNGKKEKRRAQR